MNIAVTMAIGIKDLKGRLLDIDAYTVVQNIDEDIKVIVEGVELSYDEYISMCVSLMNTDTSHIPTRNAPEETLWQLRRIEL